MKKTKLSSSEIHDLINRYKSDLKKLEFQASEVNLTISQLESLLKNVAGIEKAAILKTKKRKPTPVTLVTSKTKKKRGRPAKKSLKGKKTALPGKTVTSQKKSLPKKTATITKTTKQKKIVAKPKKIVAKPKKLKKAEDKKGYKLTFWDEYVIESIKQAGKVRITQEIVNFVSAKMKETGKNASDVEIQNKVTRSLQKLANRRGDLKKVPFEGKGLAYALPAWFGDNGKLNKENKR
jgi:hypothetical protein